MNLYKILALIIWLIIYLFFILYAPVIGFSDFEDFKEFIYASVIAHIMLIFIINDIDFSIKSGKLIKTYIIIALTAIGLIFSSFFILLLSIYEEFNMESRDRVIILLCIVFLVVFIKKIIFFNKNF